MKIGVMVDDTTMSDAHYSVMTELNNRVGGLHDIFLITSNVSAKIIKNDFAIMNSTRAANIHNGLIIATSLATAFNLKNLVSNSKKVFYIYELEWLYQLSDYDMIHDILNSGLTLICRSQRHAEVLKNNFNVSVDKILPTFNLDELWTLL